MDDLISPKNDCCSGSDCGGLPEVPNRTQPFIADIPSDEVCCGPAPGPQSSPYEKPGYDLLHFVEEFIDTPGGPVPKVKTHLERTDILGTIIARLGIGRDQYKIATGFMAWEIPVRIHRFWSPPTTSFLSIRCAGS